MIVTKELSSTMWILSVERKNSKPPSPVRSEVECRRLVVGYHLLLGLEVVEQHRALLRLLTPVLDDDAAAVDDFPGVTLTVDLAYD